MHKVLIVAAAVAVLAFPSVASAGRHETAKNSVGNIR